MHKTLFKKLNINYISKIKVNKTELFIRILINNFKNQLVYLQSIEKSII